MIPTKRLLALGGLMVAVAEVAEGAPPPPSPPAVNLAPVDGSAVTAPVADLVLTSKVGVPAPKSVLGDETHLPTSAA